jgi:hypothetical protein
MSKAKALVLAAMSLAATASVAAPESYTFTTGQTAYQGTVSGFPPGTPPPAFAGLFGGVSGSFLWDSAGSFVQFNADGSSAYAGFTSPSITGLTPSISGLSASFNMLGQAISDPNGSTSVWNDKASNFFGSGITGDALILAFDPPAANGNLFPRNLTSGSLEAVDLSEWHVYSARMLWVEGMVAQTAEFANPNVGVPIGDFLNDQSLPGAPPTFAGRLWLELQNNANPSQISFVFYNNLQVAPSIAAIPEPETYALLLAGLGLIGFVTRRRLRGAQPA